MGSFSWISGNVLFTVRGDWALVQVTNTGHGVSILGDIQKLSENGLAQHTYSGPAGAEGLHQITSRGLFQSQQFCDIYQCRVYEKLAVFRWFKFCMLMQLQCLLRRIWLFWLRQSPFTNTPLFSRLKCLLRSRERWIRLKWVYLSCTASHILLAHCMLH